MPKYKPITDTELLEFERRIPRIWDGEDEARFTFEECERLVTEIRRCHGYPGNVPAFTGTEPMEEGEIAEIEAIAGEQHIGACQLPLIIQLQVQRATLRRTLAEVRRLRAERHTPSLTEINAEAQVVALKEEIEDLETDYNMALSHIFTLCETWDDDRDCAEDPGHSEMCGAVRRSRQYLRAERKVFAERTLTLPNGTVVEWTLARPAKPGWYFVVLEYDGFAVTLDRFQAGKWERDSRHNPGLIVARSVKPLHLPEWSEAYPDRPVPGGE